VDGVEDSGMTRSGGTSPHHDFRKRYGDAIADIVDAHSVHGARPANHSAPHDIKATLQAIVAEPEAVDLARIDSLTRALLMDPAWRRLRTQSLGALTGEQLAECAKYALDHFPPLRKPIIERAEVLMTLSLLAAAGNWHAARRVNLVREALGLAFHVDYVRATAIIRKAHRELRVGT
jgi:hypothetical protein